MSRPRGVCSQFFWIKNVCESALEANLRVKPSPVARLRRRSRNLNFLQRNSLLQNGMRRFLKAKRALFFARWGRLDYRSKRANRTARAVLATLRRVNTRLAEVLARPALSVSKPILQGCPRPPRRLWKDLSRWGWGLPRQRRTKPQSAAADGAERNPGLRSIATPWLAPLQRRD